MTTSSVRSNRSNVQPNTVVELDAKNKATAARLAKAFEKAILEDGNVEIFPGFKVPTKEAATLIRMATDDDDAAGGTLEENMAHYIQSALLDHLIDFRNGDRSNGRGRLALS